MAVAFKTALGTGQATSSGTTIVITTTAAIDIGDLVVVRWASDNLNATTPTATCADGGNTYTVLRQGAVNATAAAGVAGGMLVSKATVARPSSSTITVTLSGSVAHKCAFAQSFTGVENTTRVAAVGATGTATAASAPATAAGIVAGDLVLGHIANETRALATTGDTDTTNGAWSAAVMHRSSTSGSDATNVSVLGQYKIPTATGAQTFNLTAVAAEWLCQCVVLQASPEPAITQAAYRWYDEGTESGAVALAAQDTAVTGDISNGDATGTLRIRLQSTTAVAVPAIDDWQLQYDRNASGSWINVGTVTMHVATYDSPNLTGTGATTNRLTGGTGSFVAGEVSEDGTANDKGWAGNNFTEFVYALKVKAADVANGDTLQFRIVRNGATTTMTYTVTPTINIIQTPPSVTQAAYRFYADGTEAGSAALAAEDTAHSVDLAPGDANLALRVLLQSTTAAAAPSTDYWQLQYERNASGIWAHVGAPSYTGLGGTGPLNLTGTLTGCAQSFTGRGNKLQTAGLYTVRTGNPTGNVSAFLYAHSGTFDSAGIPTGTALATSNSVPVSSVPTTAGWLEFTFDGTYTLTLGTKYFIAFVVSVQGDASNHIKHYATGGDAVEGNRATLSGGWSGTASDLVFQIGTDVLIPGYVSASLTDIGATTKRLTGGTGTYQQGEIAFDGLVDKRGFSGNNHAELLYTLLLKKESLADGDTLRFRVLRNGSTAVMTYSVTPTINVSKVATPKIETLTDDFATQDNVKWAFGAATWESGGQRVAIPVTALYPSLPSKAWYDLTGSSIFAKVTPAIGATRETYLQLLDVGASARQYAMYVSGDTGNNLQCRKTVGGVHTVAASIPYDPVNHAWWRIRENTGAPNGNILFEHSPDGTTWTPFGTATVFEFQVDNVEVHFISGYYGTETAATTYIDNVNIPGVPLKTGSASTAHAWVTSAAGVKPADPIRAKAETLTDTFDTEVDTVIKWSQYHSRVTWEAGRAKLTYATGGGGSAALGTPRIYDLEDSHFLAKVTPALGGTRTTAMYVYVTSSGSNWCGVVLNQTGIYAEAESGEPDYDYWSTTARPYDPVNDAWWRIRESSGTLYFETSPDSQTWNLLGSTPVFTPWSLSPAEVIFQASSDSDPPVDAYVDNVNVPVVAPVVYSDDFNRANGALGTPWVSVDDAPAVAGNKASGVVTSNVHSAYYNQTFSNDQWAEGDMSFTLGSVHNSLGPAVRLDAASGGYAYYVWWLQSTNVLQVYRRSPTNVYAQIGGDTPTTAPCKVRLEVEGTAIRLFKDDVQVMSTTDAVITGGKPGLLGSNGGPLPTLDNWRGGDLPYTPPTGGPSQGTATASWTVAPAAVGVRTPKGSITTAFVEAVTTAGKRIPKGAPAVTYAETVTAAGKRIPKGAPTVTYVETVTSAGKRTPKGSTTVNYVETLTTAGKKTPKGSITTAHTWVPTAAGVKPAVGVNQGSATTSWKMETAGGGAPAEVLQHVMDAGWFDDTADFITFPEALTSGSKIAFLLWGQNISTAPTDFTTSVGHTFTLQASSDSISGGINSYFYTAPNASTASGVTIQRNDPSNRWGMAAWEVMDGTLSEVNPDLIGSGTSPYSHTATLPMDNGGVVLAYIADDGGNTVRLTNPTEYYFTVDAFPRTPMASGYGIVGPGEAFTATGTSDPTTWSKTFWTITYEGSGVAGTSALGKHTPKAAASVSHSWATTAMGTRTSRGTATTPWTMSMVGPLVVVVDEDFSDGAAGASITTTGYVKAETWMADIQFDGSGNARTDTTSYAYSGHIHTTSIGNNSWAEATFLKIAVADYFNAGVSVRMPINGEIGSHGYSLYDNGSTLFAFRNGVPISGGANLGPSPTQVGVPITFRVEVFDNVFKAFVNGVERWSYTDPAPLTQGPYTAITLANTAQGQVLVQSHRAGTPSVTTAIGVAPAVGAKQGTATVGWVAQTTGTPLTTVIDDTFEGAASTPLTSVGWVDGGFGYVAMLDGAGNAAASGAAYNGALRPEAIPADCWVEFEITDSSATLEGWWYLLLRQPALEWWHGYNIAVDKTHIQIYRDDSALPFAAVAVQVGVTHTVRAELAGGNVKAFFDGELRLDWADPSPLVPPLSGPYVGFEMWVPASITDYKVRSFKAGGLATGGGAIGVAPAVPVKQGSATGAWAATATAVGRRVQSGAATTNYAETVSSLGQRVSQGGGAVTYAWVLSASGTKPAVAAKTGTAVVAWSMSSAGGIPDLLMEPFNDFTTNGWALTGSPTITAGRTGTAAQTTGSTARAEYNLGSNESAYLTVGFAFRWTDGNSTQRNIIRLWSDSGAIEHNRLVVDTSVPGRLLYTRSSTAVANSGSFVLVTNTWYYIEVQARLHDTLGSVIVRVDGIERINATGLDTRQGGTKTVYDQLRIGGAISGATNQYDDLYLRVGPTATFRGNITIPPAVAEGGGGAVGKRTPQGVVTTSYVEVLTSVGKRTPKSSAVTSYVEALISAGRRTPISTATTSFVEALTSTGKRVPRATSVVAHAWSLIAQGVKPIVGVKQGSGLGYQTWALTAVGKRTPKSTVTTAYVETLVAIGKKVLRGAATTSWSEALGAVGKRIPKSVVTTTVLQALSVAGKRTPKATTTTAHAWALSAVGIKPIVGVNQGSAVVGYSRVPTAAGKRTPRGAALTTYVEAAVAAGRRTARSVVVATHSWVLAAEGVRFVLGVDVALTVGEIRVGDRFVVGELTAVEAVEVGEFAPIAVLADFADVNDVGVLEASPPVSVGDFIDGASVGDLKAAPPVVVRGFGPVASVGPIFAVRGDFSVTVGALRADSLFTLGPMRLQALVVVAGFDLVAVVSDFAAVNEVGELEALPPFDVDDFIDGAVIGGLESVPPVTLVGFSPVTSVGPIREDK
jgi:hypothetical protein